MYVHWTTPCPTRRPPILGHSPPGFRNTRPVAGTAREDTQLGVDDNAVVRTYTCPGVEGTRHLQGVSSLMKSTSSSPNALSSAKVSSASRVCTASNEARSIGVFYSVSATSLATEACEMIMQRLESMSFRRVTPKAIPRMIFLRLLMIAAWLHVVDG
jgi:hypothetical protein